ncbi:hypothetical protein [Gallaecimonas pentaromativorans]|uniref:hypothetical protein n=1 Tax=Gallaecimonas pentaromativorans TaxID=584787 RepID=UPI003A93E093
MSEDGIDVLGCLFTDNGGLSVESALSWIIEGLKRVDAVSSGSSDSQCWDREVWGAHINVNTVKVYSLLDDSCSAVLDTSVFQAALNEWKNAIELDSRFHKVPPLMKVKKK